jgi:hypothetical protein
MDGTGSGAFRMAGFGISGVEFSGFLKICLFNDAISIETIMLMRG